MSNDERMMKPKCQRTAAQTTSSPYRLRAITIESTGVKVNGQTRPNPRKLKPHAGILQASERIAVPLYICILAFFRHSSFGFRHSVSIIISISPHKLTEY